jgi:HD domain
LYHEKFHYENTVLSMSQASRKFRTVDEAYQFLRELGAPPQLILHVQLVGEAADLLISHLHERQLKFDERLIRFGVVFHDVGKILHPSELKVAGNLHEADGERLLIEHGVEGRLARCCRSHSQWQKMECSLEELCVALADTLWKGKRIAALEEGVTSIQCFASSLIELVERGFTFLRRFGCASNDYRQNGRYCNCANSNTPEFNFTPGERGVYPGGY